MCADLKDRIKYAAVVIRRGGSATRKFDGCFEWGDGFKVVFALVRIARPGGSLERNLPKYICEDSISRAVALICDGVTELDEEGVKP